MVAQRGQNEQNSLLEAGEGAKVNRHEATDGRGAEANKQCIDEWNMRRAIGSVENRGRYERADRTAPT